jgi:hypothetical protein
MRPRLVTFTNGSADVADGLLAWAGLRGEFERLLSVEDAAARKPAPALCPRRLGLPAPAQGQRLVMMVVTGSPDRRPARCGRSARSQRDRCRGSVATMSWSNS